MLINYSNFPDSNLLKFSTILGGLAQLARALDLHSRGQGFDPLILHERRQKTGVRSQKEVFQNGKDAEKRDVQ